jgi:hypothetical protein
LEAAGDEEAVGGAATAIDMERAEITTDTQRVGQLSPRTVLTFS